MPSSIFLSSTVSVVVSIVVVVPETVKLPPTVRFPVIVPPARGSLFVIELSDAVINPAPFVS